MASDWAVGKLCSIEGIMVAGHPGQIRLLVDQAVIDLDENDVLSAGELPVPAGLVENLAQPVRLDLRRGARLLGVGATEAYEDVVWQRGELFSMRTRQEAPPWRMSESYHELERRFYAGYGIVLDDERETQP
ncbi:MAG TPA: hypothetical protein VGH73_13205 [Thermoanaerobaculia bacterium]|jgi:hypothetical protein